MYESTSYKPCADSLPNSKVYLRTKKCVEKTSNKYEVFYFTLLHIFRYILSSFVFMYGEIPHIYEVDE